MIDFVFERADRRALTFDFLQIVFQPFDLLFVSALIRVETFPKLDEQLEKRRFSISKRTENGFSNLKLIAKFFGRTRFFVVEFFQLLNVLRHVFQRDELSDQVSSLLNEFVQLSSILVEDFHQFRLSVETRSHVVQRLINDRRVAQLAQGQFQL